MTTKNITECVINATLDNSLSNIVFRVDDRLGTINPDTLDPIKTLPSPWSSSGIWYEIANKIAVSNGYLKGKETEMEKKESTPNYNVMPKLETFNEDAYAGYSIVGIKILAPGKVVEVAIGRIMKNPFYSTLSPTLADVRTYKQICRDFKYAVALALTKHLHRQSGKRLTTCGLEGMTVYYLAYSYDFNKEVNRALKAYAKLEREETLKKAREEEIKRIKERRVAKRREKKERRHGA